MTHISELIILAGSLLVVSTAIASNWADVYDEDDATIYVDKDSIKVNGNVVTHWEKWVYKKIQTSANGKPYKSRSAYAHIDCKEKTRGFTRLIEYDEDGTVVFSHDYPLDMKPIQPASRMDAISYAVCHIYQSNPSK